MKTNLYDIMNHYIVSKGHHIYFCGSINHKNDVTAANLLAENCKSFILDVEDEICIEEEVSCFNCRSRRWSNEGFSCTKQFPLKGEINA